MLCFTPQGFRPWSLQYVNHRAQPRKGPMGLTLRWEKSEGHSIWSWVWIPQRAEVGRTPQKTEQLLPSPPALPGKLRAQCLHLTKG